MKSIAGRIPSVALAATLVTGSAFAVDGIQAFAPSGSSLVPKASAKVITKKGWYRGSGGPKSVRTVTGVSIKGSKITVVGRLTYSLHENYTGNKAELKKAKRTFRIAKGCKFGHWEWRWIGESKKGFVKRINKKGPNGFPVLHIHVKNGKAVRIGTSA